MPKKAKFELVQCTHFTWRLRRRGAMWYGDGRMNEIDAGRHSLGTTDKAEAFKSLAQLDEVCAVKFGLIEKKQSPALSSNLLTLTAGRKLYEEHIGRSRVTGGVKDSTKKRYRTVFDKFSAWGAKNGVADFSKVDTNALNRYASFLEKQGYAQKTLLNELTTMKQCVRWLIEEGHLVGCDPIKLKLRKVESQRAYCYRPAEVQAILQHCRDVAKLGWVGDVVTGLACTGMRIDELANLKWSDVDFANNRITLTDESSRGARDAPKRTLKSSHSRSFPIHPDLAIVLNRLPKTDEYVFHGPGGGRLKPDYIRLMYVRDVLRPLSKQFPSLHSGQGFQDGRLHSFRHYFVSMCAAGAVPERVVMEWVGHADSSMVRHYFHLHDEESQRQMNGLSLLGASPSETEKRCS